MSSRGIKYMYYVNTCSTDGSYKFRSSYGPYQVGCPPFLCNLNFLLLQRECNIGLAGVPCGTRSSRRKPRVNDTTPAGRAGRD
eukprot:4665260-Prymnesium_polylepis.2